MKAAEKERAEAEGKEYVNSLVRNHTSIIIIIIIITIIMIWQFSYISFYIISLSTFLLYSSYIGRITQFPGIHLQYFRSIPGRLREQ